MKDNYKVENVLDRSSEDENIAHYKKKYDEMELLKNENEGLKIVLEKYNIILSEYQTKTDYGSEIFKKIEELVINEYNVTDMKLLVENVSLIREYEKRLIDKDNHIEYLNSQLVEIPDQLHKSLEENNELRRMLEEKEEELSKFYKSYLSPENGNANVFGLNSNRIDDYNSQVKILKTNNENLIQQLEKNRIENEQYKFSFNDLKQNYINLSKEYEKIKENFSKYKSETEEILKTKSEFEKRIQKNYELINQSEKENSQLNTKIVLLETEMKYLKREVDHYKDSYEDIESRKNSELEILIRELNNIKSKEHENKSLIESLKANSEEMKFQLSRSNQENQILKNEKEGFLKRIQDADFYVKGVQEKEKNIDNKIKKFKKKVEEADLEKQKSLLKQKYLENQISKLEEDHDKVIKDIQYQHESAYESAKAKFRIIIETKDEDLNNLQSDLFHLKMEKDKLSSDITILKKENDKLVEALNDENNRYMQSFDEFERETNKTQNILQEQINELLKKNEEINNEKRAIEIELREFMKNHSSRDGLIYRFTRNEEESEKTIQKLKISNSTLLREKENLEQDIERIKCYYEMKIKQNEEKFNLSKVVLEKSIRYKQDEYLAGENKAFDILRKQESVTNKIKEDYIKNMSYYEGMMSNLIDENKKLRTSTKVEKN